MYATLETYDLHDPHCPYTKKNKPLKENFVLDPETALDISEKRRKMRGGMGIDGCQPYDPSQPYMYMFDPHYNRFPYDPDYQVVDGDEEENDGTQFLNVPLYSYPDPESTTRVMYCDEPPKFWELCDDDY